MAEFVDIRGNAADGLTGERVFPGERVFDTGFRNRRKPYQGASKTILLKEETIVWLAEQAGFDVVKRDAGDSGDAKVVDGEDAGVGGGEAPVGKPKAGGSKPAKRRANGASKGK
jgi:hypothetical protein